MALTILMWLGIIALGIFVFNFILSIITGILVGVHEAEEEIKREDRELYDYQSEYRIVEDPLHGMYIELVPYR